VVILIRNTLRRMMTRWFVCVGKYSYFI